ncbi:carboxyl-terminal processing protease [Pustulibacterium marinum]|uniref:Carboxyl-terminal processing protease n=1 Tax=Pustulibacterium marinum TaxID=1224947 RepID=A0A1I7ET94_9FLAO|nr:S41 family peptidase [Pustulibacterium marinum]SFU27141.1 carboxyl-terminal processing protease [Pustulibacterium marinum]
MKKKIFICCAAIVLFFVGTSFKNDFFEISKQIEIFTTLFKELNMNYVDDTNPGELMDTAIKSMLSDLDPYTNYLNEQDVENYRINQSGEYSGIGAMVKSAENKLIIVEPYKGYPADKADLKPGDEIVKIDDIEIKNFEDNASDLLKGAQNSSIQITYKRQGKTFSTTLEREGIEIDAVPYYGKINDKTGYIVLERFNEKAAKQTKEALEDLKSQGVEKLVLDLRNNPGGLLREAINICNLFVDKGEVIVTTKSKVKKFNQTYKTRNQPLDTKIPLVILVNGRSASASEIVSGALQDLDRAVVVGGRSFGKGLVQRPLKLSYGTQLKVTISRYYTPSGRCIQALDYWHRDASGNAVRTSEKDFNAFQTRNGRTVYDGGGIMPDVEITSAKKSTFTNALIDDYIIFDYVNNYYYSHELASAADFDYSDGDYNKFKKYVSESNFTYETETERELKQLLTKDKLDDLGNEVKSSYQNLLNTIDESKVTSLDTYKPEIKEVIEKEIIKHYFYREGLYTYNLTHDEALIMATKLLTDTSKYKGILQ